MGLHRWAERECSFGNSRERARKGNDLHSSLLCLVSYWSMLVWWLVSFPSVLLDCANGSTAYQFSWPSLFLCSLKVTKRPKTLSIQLVNQAPTIMTKGDGLTPAWLVTGWTPVVLVGSKRQIIWPRGSEERRFVSIRWNYSWHLMWPMSIHPGRGGPYHLKGIFLHRWMAPLSFTVLDYWYTVL